MKNHVNDRAFEDDGPLLRRKASPDARPIIDPEFQALLPKLDPEEFDLLERQLLAGGIRDPLVVWDETGILLDGHNRLGISERQKLPHRIVYVSLPDRAAAFQWVIDNQLGRRNLTDERRSYYRGKEYLNKKKAEGRPSGKLSQSETVSGSTDEAVAEKHGVSPATVHRDAAFAEAVDKIGEAAPEAKEEILSGKTGQTKQQVIDSAKPQPMCERCRIHGPPNDGPCPVCWRLRRPPRRPSDRPKPGVPKVDWKEFDRAMGVLQRFPDEIGRNYEGQKNGVEDQAARKLLDALAEVMHDWRRELRPLDRG